METALSTLAQVFVSPLVGTISDYYGPAILEKIGVKWDVNDEMEELSVILLKIQDVLEDAEDKQLTSKLIRHWLRKLKDIAYDVEDLLDECATEALNDPESTGITDEATMVERIKQLINKFNQITEQRSKYNLINLNSTTTVVHCRVDPRRETSSFPTKLKLHGRDEEKECIVNHMVNNINAENLSIYAIVGIGGLGKTTLAQMVYNDNMVETRFEIKRWVCVSENFELKSLIEDIIQSGSNNSSETLDQLQRHLQDILRGKRFLLVLDDVWNEDHTKWERLKSSFTCGEKGSSIIVTTRSDKVASLMGISHVCHPKILSEEDCFSLFKHQAFVEGEGERHLNLESIGKQIVKKCGGVPLAAKALGGLLRFQREEKEWLFVKESKLWDLPQDKDDSILPALRLSYKHLPQHLRQFFAYCSIFPKDHRMENDVLAQKTILLGFELVSGLHINLSKSKILAVGVVDDLEILANTSGCGMDVLPSSYLGLPLGAKSLGSAKWNVVIERVEKRLATWKRPLLSKGGRITLIQSVLANLPLYFFSLFVVPSLVVTRLERIMKNFLWEDREGNHKYHLVNWESITFPKKEGGLGIRKLKTMNGALLGKWLWRFGVEVDALWRLVIVEKYGVGDHPWVSKRPRDPYGVSVWRGIYNNLPSLKKGVIFEVHEGTRVRFWEDWWVGDMSFDIAFPLLYGLSRNKLCSIANIFEGGLWNLGTPSRIGVMANREKNDILRLVADFCLDPLSDKRIWALEKSHLFSVRSLYSAMSGNGEENFPASLIWNCLIPVRVSFFAWTAVLGKILTVTHLRRRGKDVTDLCYFCNIEEEDVAHLLLHCSFSQQIWSRFWRLFGTTMLLPSSVKELYVSWQSSQFHHRAKVLWRLLPSPVIWALWKERNERAFNRKFRDQDQVFFDVLQLLHSWASISGDFQGVRLEDFIVRWVQIVFDPG